MNGSSSVRRNSANNRKVSFTTIRRLCICLVCSWVVLTWYHVKHSLDTTTTTTTRQETATTTTSNEVIHFRGRRNEIQHLFAQKKLFTERLNGLPPSRLENNTTRTTTTSTTTTLQDQFAEMDLLTEEQDTQQEQQQEDVFDMLPGEDELDMVQKIDVTDTSVIPFVYMVYKRVDYLNRSMTSLMQSDFDRQSTPLIISMDGHVEEMMTYVEKTLKPEFPHLQIWIHPYSCHDHPTTFPGNDPKLNHNYKGDMHGNKRSAWATCAKHHFAWMIHEVFETLQQQQQYPAFVFMEEDYIVSPTIVQTTRAGINLLNTVEESHLYLGIGYDPMEGYSKLVHPSSYEPGWMINVFKTGPMALPRRSWKLFQKHAFEFCQFDDYNWDWSMVHMIGRGMLPGRILVPSRKQVLHIGVKDGMHSSGGGRNMIGHSNNDNKLEAFTGQRLLSDPRAHRKHSPTHNRGYGGWGHAADQQHCLQLLKKR